MSEAAIKSTFDKETLRKKYAEERDKRIRTDGNDQYIQLKDKWDH